MSPKQILLHHRWSPWTINFDGDLSLLRFETGSIHLNSFVQPICIWDYSYDPTESEGFVAGWGKSEDSDECFQNVPKRVKALIQTNEDCFLEEPSLLEMSSLRTFCAGLRNGSGVCFGDSGSGLFIKVDGVYYLIGIVSSGRPDGEDCGVFINAIYTNVLKFRNWITGKPSDLQLPSRGEALRINKKCLSDLQKQFQLLHQNFSFARRWW